MDAQKPELAKVYEPKSVESRWYAEWLQKKYFRSTPDDRKPFTVVIPPPNVTGVLHMGHMLNNTIQDVLVRRARMLGFNACWVPGTDHASIATEAKVVQFLRTKGIKKSDLSRDEFLKHAWEWKEKHGGIILEQLKKLGASCDWDRTRFTMEEDLTDAVLDVFIDLYKKGYIYRGLRMVNWDPKALTAVSDEEVIYKNTTDKLYYVKYPLEENPSEGITIATTRPETIFADTAVCVNPDDARYTHLIGKKVVVPFTGRTVSIIADAYVEKEFGTGCLKVTPAHDQNDYELGKRHNLEVIDMLNADGTVNAHGGSLQGMDRFTARKAFAQMLEEGGFMVKTEDLTHAVGYSERTDEVIEPRLSMQWFLNMQALATPALKAVMEDYIQLLPEKYKNTYRHWMENIRDWCISRQLWWGQRIPAWYDETGNFVVAKTEVEARKLFAEKYPHTSITPLRQDDDVLDTWFSSWLWPISVFDGFKDPKNADISYYYPTDVLVTAPEILFFWVARMIMAGYEYRGDRPFKTVYLTGIVRDKLGRKMSKSLGNSPDPIDLMDKYGADGVRVGMLLSSPAGNDLLFDEALCEQGRNFANKIWNAFRLTQSWTVDASLETSPENQFSVRWFEANLLEKLTAINQGYDQFRISEVLMSSYKLFWDDFCSWYLEMVKPAYGQPIDKATYDATITFFDQMMRVLHPFMPFITEEIWHLLSENRVNETIQFQPWPELGNPAGLDVLEAFTLLEGVVTAVRNIRSKVNLSPVVELQLTVKTNTTEAATALKSVSGLLRKLVRVTAIEAGASVQKPGGAMSAVFFGNVVYVPLKGLIDVEAEKARITKEITRLEGFRKSIEAKLSNERFVAGAPVEVVEKERQKFNDAGKSIEQLADILKGLE
jgi:valyl-tRNA synthetase